MLSILRTIVPDGRLLFRAAAYAVLALVSFTLPTTWAWWVGMFMVFMSANILIGKTVANVSDLFYRVLTGRHIDRRFDRWREVMATHCPDGDAPDNAYELYQQGMTPRQAAEFADNRLLNSIIEDGKDR